MNKKLALGAQLLVLFAGGCGFRVESGGVLCGPLAECPQGFECRFDGRCHREGVGISLTCGDGVVDVGETCDPAGSCPSTCEDGNACTLDVLVGKPENCNVSCIQTNVEQCSSGDQCCPVGCTSQNDSDCSASCGDDDIGDNETCDPPASCPTECRDNNTCTTDILTGSAENCNASCSFQAIAACVDGDECCPTACNRNNDNDCSATCGNTTLEEGETCDPPESCDTNCDDGIACTADTSVGNPSNCNFACVHNTISNCENGDGCCPGGCSANSDNDCSPSCGNEEIEGNETCDPPSSCPTNCNDGDVCTNDILIGDPADCSAQCIIVPITQCGPADGCCPDGCEVATEDPDCIQVGEDDAGVPPMDSGTPKDSGLPV